MNTTEKQKKNRFNLYILVAILAISSLIFRIILAQKLEQTAILFVGIPALITLLIIKYSKKPKSAYAVMFQTVTLFLMMASVLFGEGLVCIIFGAPIFYGIGALLTFIYEYIRRKDKEKLYSFILISIILILAQPQEMVSDTSSNRISSTVVFNRSVSLDELDDAPDFSASLPAFFNIGFPMPVKSTNEGLEIGQKRTIWFESKTKGVGELTFELISKESNKAVFKCVSDNTHINHWLTWIETEVEITPAENGSEVTWTSNFNCDLGPSWYFETIEIEAVKLMNKHLINSYFQK